MKIFFLNAASVVALLWASTVFAAKAPEGMVFIPAGSFLMGSNHQMMTDARPVHKVKISSFYMDETEVTNRQFAKFVEQTDYQTLAERPLDSDEFPGVSVEFLKPGTMVFSKPNHPVSLHNELQWWQFIAGANWQNPEGPGSTIESRLNHPVVHIAWEDAVAYGKWAGKRLPTEAEWEYAARGGLEGKNFVWGDEFKPDEHYRANTYQGRFPDNNTALDGFVATSPVKRFPVNGYGLYDMAGNAWEWVSDWYHARYYQQLSSIETTIENPQGPDTSFDPTEPQIPKRVQKGGSFLCTDQYCSRYMPGARGRGDPNTSSNHVGFRLVRNI